MSSLVSVIIPSYNHRRYIEETISSVVQQTYTNIELIVVDDGSTDGSPEFLKTLQLKYKFELVCKANEGLCKTINRGLDLVKGEFVVIIASDDFMPAGRITEQVVSFQGQSFDVVAGGMTTIDENSKIIKYVRPLKTGKVEFYEMLDKSLIYAPTAMFKQSTFVKFGRFNPEHLIEDYSMWLNILSKKGEIANFDRNWAYYRVFASVSRAKIDWYFKGLSQVFSGYLQDPLVAKAFYRRKLKYLAKVALLDGVVGLRRVLVENPNYLTNVHILGLNLIALIPSYIRSKMRGMINRS